jgi:putative FmdB family regulatory protein
VAIEAKEYQGEVMPIFEYQCQKCQHCFEQLVPAGQKEHEPACPHCGAAEVAKLMSCINSLGGGKSAFCSPGSSGFS